MHDGCRTVRSIGDDSHGLGYERVDADPNASVLLATMDATGGWSATLRLRASEAEQLGLTTGQRLLDVGCGLGDAGLALAIGLGEDGELVGIDASGQMIAAARSRASGVPCPVRFSVGDAHTLEEPDNSFDAVRSERTLRSGFAIRKPRWRRWHVRRVPAVCCH